MQIAARISEGQWDVKKGSREGTDDRPKASPYALEELGLGGCRVGLGHCGLVTVISFTLSGEI